jgi:adenine-specific DNA-methyltransferase
MQRKREKKPERRTAKINMDKFTSKPGDFVFLPPEPKGKVKAAKSAKPAQKREADYRHPEVEAPLRPDVGTQAQFRKKKPPATYRYDSSLSPALDWDGQNAAREQGEAAIREILDLDQTAIENAATVDDAKKAARATVAKAKAAAEKLKRLGKPFLDWTGKAERLSFDVPTLPLFVHERLSTKAIIETLKSHEKRSTQSDMFELFGDPKRSVADQVLKAYEYRTSG